MIPSRVWCLMHNGRRVNDLLRDLKRKAVLSNDTVAMTCNYMVGGGRSPKTIKQREDDAKRKRESRVAMTDDKGKVTPKKIGLAPIQREGMEYEFTVFGELDLDHNLNITKSRCSAIAGKLVEKPGKQLADVLKAWLETGAPAEAPKPKLVLAEAETDVDDSRAQSPLTVVSGLIANAKRVRELEAVKPRIQELDAFLREQAIPQYNERLKVLVAENEALKKAPQTAKPDEKAAEPSAATPPVSDKKIAEPSTPFDDPEAGRPDAPAVHERQPGDDTEEVKAELTQAQKDEADAKALSDDLEKATTVTEINALAPRFKLLTAAMQAQLRKPFSSRKADLTKAGKL